MTDRDHRTQADLLDSFMESLSAGQPNPPADLDPALASVAVTLSAELTPPAPSTRFVRGLEQQLASVPAGNSHSETLPPSGESELSVTQTDAGWQVTETTHRSRFFEFARLAAAVLAIMLIGSMLVFLFSDRDGADGNNVGGFDSSSGNVPGPVTEVTPTPQSESTLIDDPTSTPEILTGPPRVSLTYEDQTQSHGAHTSCWPTSPDGEVLCSESDREVPELPAIQVSSGAPLSFEVVGDHTFTPLGAAAVRLVPTPYPDGSDTYLTFDFPGTPMPFEQGPDGTVIIADVPDGDYSFEVGIALDIYDWGFQGNANYAFRVVVGDPESAAQNPAIPSAWLTSNNDRQQGVFAYGCGWPGFDICVDPAGLDFPGSPIGAMEGHELPFDIEGFSASELVMRYARAYPLPDHPLTLTADGNGFLTYPYEPEIALEMHWSPDGITILADLPPGDYAIDVTVGLASEVDPPVDGRATTSSGSATYGFHLRVFGVGDPSLTPTPNANTDIDPFTPAFPDAEVVHVVAEIHTENASYQTTRIADIWIDQTTGDTVAYYEDGEGQLLTINVRQGLTSWEFDATVSHLWVTTVQEPDDPTLPDPAHPLNMFRQILQRAEEISNAGGEIIRNASYEGQQAIKIVIPMSESGEVYGEVEAYLHPETLFPMAIIGPGDDDLQVYSYPTIETLDRNEVDGELFSPEMPGSDSTRLNERLTIDEARAFTDVPIWWLGEEIAGHQLERIDHTLNTSIHGMSPEQFVHILYRTSPESMDITFQVLSQGPLSDQEEAARSHSRTQATEILVDGSPGWFWDGTSSSARIEIELPDGYVTIHLEDPDTVDVALEALERLNAE